MNDFINKNHELFYNMHPCLRDNFIKLCTNGKIGLTPVSVNNISIVQTKLIDSKYAYSFRIHVPFAGKFLNWQILFDPENLEFPPDFDFNDDRFPQTLNVDEVAEKVPTLLNWSLKNSGSLEAVLKEFLQLFKQYQIKELSNNNIYSRIADEYQLLTSVEDICPEDVELLLESTSVMFVISIEVELSDLPEYVQVIAEDGSLLNPKEDFALLHITFQKLDASRVSVQLQLSPRLDQLIGNSKTFRIPNYEKDESSLVEYVPLISRLLQQQIKEVAFRYQYKKEFLTALVALRCNSILEYDSSSFNEIAFLCEIGNYMVIVQIVLGEDFPREKPLVKLHSLYCVHPRTKIPCERALDFKSVSTKPPDEMAKHLLEVLKSAIPNFKVHPHIANTRGVNNRLMA